MKCSNKWDITNSVWRALIPGLKCGCKQFDEQLQFVNEEDKPLSNVDYVITRADGMKVKGTTDNEGKTKRIKNTQQEIAIEKVEFFATKWTQPLCPLSRIPAGTLLETVKLAEKTTQANIGSSVKKVTLKGKGRPLTPGEIDMAKLVFKENGIDYGTVQVYRKKYWITLGFQPNDIGMVPDGNMYCPEGVFSEDYSIDPDPYMKIWFMHEMTHVWQTQLGLSTILSAADIFSQGGYKNDNPAKPPIGYRYDPAKCVSKTLPDFNFEQQAEIISHYYAANYLKDGRYSPKLLFYESVLKDFLIKPKDSGHLPRTQPAPSPGVDEISKGGY